MTARWTFQCDVGAPFAPLNDLIGHRLSDGCFWQRIPYCHIPTSRSRHVGEGGQFHHWELGFKHSSLHHVARALRDRGNCQTGRRAMSAMAQTTGTSEAIHRIPRTTYSVWERPRVVAVTGSPPSWRAGSRASSDHGHRHHVHDVRRRPIAASATPVRDPCWEA